MLGGVMGRDGAMGAAGVTGVGRGIKSGTDAMISVPLAATFRTDDSAAGADASGGVSIGGGFGAMGVGRNGLTAEGGAGAGTSTAAPQIEQNLPAPMIVALHVEHVAMGAWSHGGPL